MKFVPFFLLLVLFPFTLLAQVAPPRQLNAVGFDNGDPWEDGVITLTWIPPDTSGNLYENDFDNNDLTGWVFDSGDGEWTCEDGFLRLLVDNDGAIHWYSATYAGSFFYEYILDVDFSYDAPQNTQDDDNSIWFNIADLSFDYDPPVTVKVQFFNPDPPNDPIIEFTVHEPYTYRLFSEPVPIPAEPNFFHHMTLVVQDYAIAVYVDGIFISYAHTPDIPFQFGYCGLVSGWRTTTEDRIRFDNLKISSVNPEDEILMYNLYANGQLVESCDPSTSHYDYQLPEYGSYSLAVTAVTNSGESTPTDPVQIQYDDPMRNVVFFEGFDDGLPPTWTIVTSRGASSTWYVNSGSRGFPRPPYMECTSYSQGSTKYTSLISPEFSIASPNSPDLVPQLIFFNYNIFGGSAKVQISTNGGGIYTTLRSMPAHDHPQADTISLVDYRHENSVRLRFEVERPYIERWWQLDEIYVRLVPSDDVDSDAATDVNEYDSAPMPDGFEIHSVAPNPFNASTTIRLHLPNPGNLSVKVFNTLGQQVRILNNGPLNAGGHAFALDGSSLASGVYVLLAEFEGQSIARKVVLMK